MRIFFVLQASVLLGEAFSSPLAQKRGSQPGLPYDPKTVADCTWWHDNEDGTSCESIIDDNQISLESFRAWNPSIGQHCEGLEVGRSYCVEGPDTAPATTQIPTVTTQKVVTKTSAVTKPTTTKPDNGIPTPQPTQPNIVDNCDQFYMVQLGESCEGIAAKHKISLAQFLKWNPSAGPQCSGLWAEAYCCVSVVGHDGTPTQPDNGISTPKPTQPDIVNSCRKFHKAQLGQSCVDIAADYGISVADFVTWNRKVKGDCSGLWADSYACVAVVNDYRFDKGHMAGWNVYDGQYNVRSEALVGSGSSWGKALLDTGFNDFVMEADIMVDNNSGNAGLVLRATNPGKGPDSYRGYYVGIGVSSDGGFVTVGRVNNSWHRLRRVVRSIRSGQTYRLKVEATGDFLVIYLDGQRVTDVRDGTFRRGLNGVRTHETGASFDNIKVTPLLYDGFEKNMVGWTIHDGGFDARTGKLVVNNIYSGKTTLNARFRDLVYEAEVKITGGSGNAGLIFRAANLRSGPDSYNGYYAGIEAAGGGKVLLGRADGGWKGLKSAAMSIRQGQVYHIKVRAVGNSLQVYVDDMKRPRLEVSDGKFSSGSCGVRVFNSGAEFDNIKIANA